MYVSELVASEGFVFLLLEIFNVRLPILTSSTGPTFGSSFVKKGKCL